MREIIQIQCGQCGNQLGDQFWQTVSEEHSINQQGIKNEKNDLQIEKTQVYFNQTSKGKYIARSVQVDLDPGTLDNIKSSSYYELYNENNFISSHLSTGSNWAKGHYTEGPQVIDQIVDAIRHEVEISDQLQGIQITHSIGGGTGSGLGTLILNKMREFYPNKIVTTFTVFPSPKVSDNVLEYYNSVLSMHHLVEQSEMNMILDNEALYNLCFKNFSLNQPVYADLNHLISQAMSGITSSFRYHGYINADLRKLAHNLVPFPRIHFLMVNQAPLCYRQNLFLRNYSGKELLQMIFEGQNLMCSVNPSLGHYYTASTQIRGKISTYEVEDYIAQAKLSNSNNYCQWIPNHIMTSYCEVQPKNMQTSMTFLSNSSTIAQLFRRINSQMNAMFRKKYFLHWYLNEGQDEMEFTEAESNVNDLISEYDWNTSNNNVVDEDYF